MPKREKVSTDSPPVTPKRSRVSGGILKAEGTPSSGHSRSVTFPPTAHLAETLDMLAGLGENTDLGEEEFSSLMAMLEHLQGPSLVLWLEELQVYH